MKYVWSVAPQDPDGGILAVDVRLNVYKISGIDTVAGTMHVKIGVFTYWNDHRLVGNYTSSDTLPSNLWGPRFRVSNSTTELVETNIEVRVQFRKGSCGMFCPQPLTRVGIDKVSTKWRLSIRSPIIANSTQFIVLHC